MMARGCRLEVAWGEDGVGGRLRQAAEKGPGMPAGVGAHLPIGALVGGERHKPWGLADRGGRASGCREQSGIVLGVR